MRIIDMVNCKLPEATKKPQSVPSAAFDMLLTEAGRRQSFEPAVETQGRNRDENRERNRSVESRRNEQPRRDEEIRTEEATSSAGAAVTQEQQQTTDYEPTASYDYAPVSEEETIAKVAEIMQVPAEKVAEWLQGLDMEATDLYDAQAVVKMLQVALDAENTGELLNNEEFPKLYKAVNEAMAEVAAKTVKADVVEQAKETVNAMAEDLEVTLEDGEVVVKNANENSANNRQSDTAQTAETQTLEQGEVEIADAKLVTAEETVSPEPQAPFPTVSMETTAAKVEQTVRQTATQQPVNSTDVIEQIMNQVKLVSGGGQFNEIRMTLKPETLGDIVLRVITQNGIVMAQFEAESQRVKEALEADFNSLRNALEEAGIKFSELSVSVRQDENERMSQFERARQNSRHRAESIEATEEPEPQEISYHNGVIDVTA